MVEDIGNMLSSLEVVKSIHAVSLRIWQTTVDLAILTASKVTLEFE